MAWKKYFTPATNGDSLSPVSVYNSSARPGPARTNYSSYLPDVYTGSPNRIDRYSQYEVMDSDPEINAALDILAEFCTQKLKDGKSPFTVNWRSKATNSEVRILGEYLQQWNKLQLFDTRIFRIVRNTFKYGDSFFIRDPETQKWCWIDATKIVKVIVNESDGKKPEQYVIKDLAPNFESLVATQITPNVNPRQTGGAMPNGASFGGNAGTAQSTNSSNRWGLSETEHAVSAEHVIHLSLSEGLDNNYPFGNSLLENIFKVYKQKELLEDAILIYRIQRAPERRIFHIDVGNMPAHLAMAFVERVKNEIHQRRIPSQTGGGCFAMDTRVPLLDGRILSIADLALEFEQGKENWAYSCNPETREMVPGIISWAGVTQKAAKVIELTLDNGEKIICTPEHKFPIVGKGKTEAKDIVANEDSLISLASDINQVNKVGSIMELDAPIEVGTLTIDGAEINHNFHTFAIEQGVYTFNSNVIDSAYNPMCLDLSTKIPLLDGRVLSLSDIITEFEQGRQNWIYSCDPSTGKVMPGVVDWAGVTRRNTNTIKITLDNGEILIVTPDHKIPVFGKGFVEAQDLIPSDRLISFITTGDDYQQIWDHATNEWIWTHKMVGGFFKDKKKHQEFTYLEENCHEPKTTIHYKDGNTLNNDPRNIGYMGEDDHTLYHYTRQKSFWQTVSTMDGEAASEIAHIINKWDTISDKEKLSSFYDMRKEITYTVGGHANFNNLELTEKEINPTTKIVKIEKVENRDVGTITVDGKERWHSHHTFAIASGIFVKNSINEDYFFPMTADGRGSKVDTLPGGQSLGEISDLQFFTNKLFRGLRIPSSYLPTGADDSQANFNDGRVGTAYIQELRFNKYCERLQSLITHVFDEEFKLYMDSRGVNIDSSLFELQFNPPMNFASSRQASLDTERINTFNTMQQIPYMSKRFALKRFLGLTDEEVADNERLWGEESGKGQPTHTDSAGELRSAGLSAAGIEGDLGMAGNLDMPPEMEDGLPPDGNETPNVAPPAQ